MIAFSDVMNKQDDVADCENGDYDGHNVDEDYDGVDQISTIFSCQEGR